MNNREKFEQHAKEVLRLCIDIGVDGEYESDRTRENWITWQAAHAESAARTREWVGLTDNEMSYCWIGKEVSGTAFDIYFFARAIETKLKEKNT
jgi:hypothetical protein